MWPKKVGDVIFRKTKQDDKVIAGVLGKDGEIICFTKWDAKDCAIISVLLAFPQLSAEAELDEWLAKAIKEMDGD